MPLCAQLLSCWPGNKITNEQRHSFVSRIALNIICVYYTFGVFQVRKIYTCFYLRDPQFLHVALQSVLCES